MAHQVHVLLVLVRVSHAHDVIVPRQVVHDRHLAPHVLRVLLRPVQTRTERRRDWPGRGIFRRYADAIDRGEE
eukprot:8686757-Pyramimonas_sp.AAC.2